MCDYDENHIQNIDLAYTYTIDYLKQCSIAINNIKLRQGTFLGFAGLLLRFNLDLSDSKPIYLFTKIGALFTSFCSIFILGWALRAYLNRAGVDPCIFMEDSYLQSPNVEIKLEIIKTHTIACDDIYFSVIEQKKLLNLAISFLVFSAFFVTLNGVLVSFLGQ